MRVILEGWIQISQGNVRPDSGYGATKPSISPSSPHPPPISSVPISTVPAPNPKKEGYPGEVPITLPPTRAPGPSPSAPHSPNPDGPYPLPSPTSAHEKWIHIDEVDHCVVLKYTTTSFCSSPPLLPPHHHPPPPPPPPLFLLLLLLLLLASYSSPPPSGSHPSPPSLSPLPLSSLPPPLSPLTHPPLLRPLRQNASRSFELPRLPP